MPRRPAHVEWDWFGRRVYSCDSELHELMPTNALSTASHILQAPILLCRPCADIQCGRPPDLSWIMALRLLVGNVRDSFGFIRLFVFELRVRTGRTAGKRDRQTDGRTDNNCDKCGPFLIIISLLHWEMTARRSENKTCTSPHVLQNLNVQLYAEELLTRQSYVVKKSDAKQ